MGDSCLMSLSLLLAVACVQNTTIGIGGDGDDDGGTGTPRDTAIDELPGDTTDTGEDTGEPVERDRAAEAAWQDEFFVNTKIHQYEITLDEDNYRALRRDGHSFAVADLTVDGETVPGVGIRLRGKIGSYRELSQKPKFKFDLNEYNGEQRLHGLKTMLLNNSVVDCSYLREPIGYQVFRDAGLPASRTSFAHVEVNGENYGLYVVIEAPDSELLRVVHPEDDEGNLYDGKYVYDWNTGNYTMLDFAANVDSLYALEEGTEVENADIVAVSDAVWDAPRGPGYQAAVDPLVDWEQWHTAWALEQWTGHLDGYQMNRNNYRVYFRPSDGKMEYVPTDFDYAFLSDGGWGVWWTGPIGVLASRCFIDADCADAHRASLGSMLERIDPNALRAQLAEMKALIADEAADDPRRECGTSDVWATQSYLDSWISGRDAQVRAAWRL